MNNGNARQSELWQLLEALCEDRMTVAQETRLQHLVLSDDEARRFYLAYVDLHGALYWDTAIAVADAETVETERGGATPLPVNRDARFSQDELGGNKAEASRPAAHRASGAERFRKWGPAAAVVLTASLLLAAGVFLYRHYLPRDDAAGIAASSVGDGSPREDGRDDRPLVEDVRPRSHGSHPRGPLPHTAAKGAADPNPRGRSPRGRPVEAPEPAAFAQDDGGRPGPENRSTASPVALINEQVEAGWLLAGIEPSPVADDGEWIRRVYLHITGRIPTAETVERFLADGDPEKRSRLIERLLEDPAYVDNWTTVWTNLLIGRSESPGVSRPALRRFLRRSFARNRPYDEIVYELVSAEGDYEENGATNFLLAHLNNEAVPATAITARLFLGTQVQCTQCHHHPFNQWKQNQFWELNSFFQQTEVVRDRKRNPQSGKTERTIRLGTKPLGEPIFYQDRRGVLQAALPRFNGIPISAEPEVNRRRRLAELMTAGENPQIARAVVNRMWKHFFGVGFTRPVDDMGPHNPPTHPALLDGLARRFVDSGYDLKQLIRWITNARPYQLTSRYGETNQADDPAAGETPWFSRVYVKSMTPEQLYDSLLVATRADRAGAAYWNEVQRRRREWLQQFVVAFDTEENDETTLFNGTVPQALALMNGELVRQAVSAEPGTYLHQVIASPNGEPEKIRSLFVASLSRYPTDGELQACRKLLDERISNRRGPARRKALHEGLQDLFWATLNSSEFILVH